MDATKIDNSLRRALDQKFGETVQPGKLCDTCEELLKLPIIANWQSLWMGYRDVAFYQRPNDPHPLNSLGTSRSLLIGIQSGPEQPHFRCRGFSQRAPHHKRLQDLQLSASTGCHLCLILLSARSGAGCPPMGDLMIYLYKGEYLRHKPIMLQFISQQTEDGNSDDNIYDIKVEFCPDYPLQQYLYFWENGELEMDDTHVSISECPRIFNHEYETLTTHQAHTLSLEKYKNWLLTCTSEHTLCCSLHSPKIHGEIQHLIPTRLIEITDSGLRLWCSDNSHLIFPDMLEYATLSYRWGDKACADQSLLTEDKLQKWQDAIEFGVLPKTIQDAIYVTHHLGIRYLWVDRLCILQDSGTDFYSEAIMMGRYYANSTLNIAALSAEDADEGFLQSREPLSFQPLHLKSLGLTVISNSVLLHGPTPLSANDRVGLVEAASRTLQTRGWVFQEEHLSPRLSSDTLFR